MIVCVRVRMYMLYKYLVANVLVSGGFSMYKYFRISITSWDQINELETQCLYAISTDPLHETIKNNNNYNSFCLHVELDCNSISLCVSSPPLKLCVLL